jgi:hypothetical protein
MKRVIDSELESRIKNKFFYNHDDGKIYITIWHRGIATVKSIGHNHKLGNNKTYNQIIFEGRVYYSHIMAWFLVYGEWPCRNVLHIDGNCTNNLMSNLTMKTEIDPIRKKMIKSSKFTGVSRNSNGRWQARLLNKYIGCFGSEALAAKAYNDYILSNASGLRHKHKLNLLDEYEVK